MEYLGLFAFIVSLWLCSYPGEIKKLKRRVETLERKAACGAENEEVADMSRLLEELKGKWCIMDADDLDEDRVRVCDTDGEWVKVEYKEKATRKEPERTKTVLIRANSIESVEILKDEGVRE